MKILYKSRLILFLTASMIFLFSACSDKNSSKNLVEEPISEITSINSISDKCGSPTSEPRLESDYQQQEGVASWFGSEYHGKVTASGELCDMNKMTAAHNTIPFGSLIEVTDVYTGSSVIVRINDRGPSIGRRIVNLSRLAAEKMNFIGKGLTKVKIKLALEKVKESTTSD